MASVAELLVLGGQRSRCAHETERSAGDLRSELDHQLLYRLAAETTERTTVREEKPSGERGGGDLRRVSASLLGRPRTEAKTKRKPNMKAQPAQANCGVKVNPSPT